MKYLLPLCLSGMILIIGCDKNGPPATSETKPPDRGISPPDRGVSPLETLARAGPIEEDPEVTAAFKAKDWDLYRDILRDGKTAVLLRVTDTKNIVDPILLTEADCRLIVRAKSIEALDLTRVEITDDQLKILATMPKLRFIVVGGKVVTDAGVRHLVGCPTLDNLFLRSTKKITGSCLEGFAGSKNLRTVVLDSTEGLTDDALKHLSKIPNLRDLKIDGALENLTDDGLRHLSEIPKLDSLRIRGSGGSKFTSAGIKAIVDTTSPAQFDFPRNLLDDALVESLVAKSSYGPFSGLDAEKADSADKLRTISLDGSKVTDKGFAKLLNCTNVKSLYLRQTGITDESLKKIGGFKSLTTLYLGDATVTAKGLEAVSALPIIQLDMENADLTEDAFKAFGKMTSLEDLGLDRAKLKPEWIKHITSLPKLKKLSLNRAAFDDAAAQYVKSMPAIEALILLDTMLSDKGFQELVTIPTLKELNVDRTNITKDAYVKAKKEYPKLRLYYYKYD